MTFRPYTKEDKLEVGTKIRLAGREGEISMVEKCDDYFVYVIKWEYIRNAECVWLSLDLFPGLEIASKPLTIDKRVKEELINRFGKEFPSYAKDNEFVDFLNSLEEV